MNTDPEGVVHERERQSSGASSPAVAENGREEQLLFTIRQVALILGCHKASVYRLVYQGKLRICRAFGSIRIPRKEIERLIADVKTYGIRQQ
jgi:excisionase family DNA binding protein